MGGMRSTARTGTARRLTILGVFSLLAFCVQLMLAATAAATPYTGGVSPTIFSGGADLNGDGDVSGRDDANAFYGDTSIIDGHLDCNAWTSNNDGTAGDGVINGNDDCTLIGYDGTVNGVTINVLDGEFVVPDGALPTIFNAGDPDNPDIGDSDFAWSTINGRVDSSGNETINANDCHFGLIGQTVDVGLGDPTDGADVLGNTQTNTNPCGFGNPPSAADNGLVDLNSDGDITGADSCTNGCFFRRNVTLGVVQVEGAVAAAGGFSGGFSPTIRNGLADLNGDRVVNGRDDSNAFYGDTSIIDGALDCNAWASDNDGAAGDGVINASDHCTLIGYDGTADGITIEVVDGEFQVANGPLPTIFNAANPDNPDVGDSDFAWSAINGRVDSNGNEFIDSGDCHFGLIGQTVDAGLGDATDGADILGNTQANTNPCGFANPPAAANNGLVDLNSDGNITSADSCTTGCFFGHNLRNGLVQGLECPGFAGDPRNDVRGTPGPETLAGTQGPDIICAFGGDDILLGRGGRDLLLGGSGADTLRGHRGADRLRGGAGRDRLFGGRRSDSLFGGRGNDRLFGELGNDRLFGGAGNDRVFGNRGNDRLFGNRGRDHLDGGAGTDACFGGPGIDTFVRCEIH
jgi:Ca2+-binding RTX toxin-like protein